MSEPDGMKMSRRHAASMIAGGTAGLLVTGSTARAEAAITQSILQRAISSSGEKLPAIGLGSWQVFDVGPGAAERQPLEEVLSRFVTLGGRVVDSSPMYGRAEQVIAH